MSKYCVTSENLAFKIKGRSTEVLWAKYTLPSKVHVPFFTTVIYYVIALCVLAVSTIFMC